MRLEVLPGFSKVSSTVQRVRVSSVGFWLSGFGIYSLSSNRCGGHNPSVMRFYNDGSIAEATAWLARAARESDATEFWAFPDVPLPCTEPQLTRTNQS